MATPNWVGGCGVNTLLERKPFSDDNRGQSQQEELRGDGGEKGEAKGFFHFHRKVKVSLVLSLLLFCIYLCQCLKRAGAESASNKCFTDFEASNCSNRH